MALINSDVIPASAPAGGYTIDQSLRFNDDDTAYLSRTPSSAGNRKTWTFSCWIKRGALGNKTIFSAGDNGDVTSMCVIKFNAGFSNGVEFIDVTLGGGASAKYYRPLPAYRDSSAWYHLVVAVDTTQSTESNRVKLYMNGVAPTDFVTGYPTYPAQNTEYHINNTKPHFIGGYSYEIAANPFDGYLSEVNLIDGQQLDPSYFGETGTYGEWKPIEYTGTYGTNGFYLDFDGTYYNDKSGNGNNWTANNLASTDVVLDSPTNNFCTLNPLSHIGSTADHSFLEGNLKITASTPGYGRMVNGSFGIPKDTKAYFEFCLLSSGYGFEVGIDDGVSAVNYSGDNDGGRSQLSSNTRAYIGDARKIVGTTTSSYGSTWTTVGDIIGVAVDRVNDTIQFYTNNNAEGTFSISSTADCYPLVASWSNGSSFASNFGQDSSFAGNKTAQGNTDDNSIGDFYYTPPSGYLALCTANLPDPAVIPSEHFNTVLYTGNDSTQSITGVGFQPDFLWIKARSATQHHALSNAITGAGKHLASSLTRAEVTSASGSDLTSFDSDGFSLGSSNYDQFNYPSTTYVAWNWKANGSGVSNTNGTITSTVSANQDAGFSIVSWNQGASNPSTIGHGLSQTPELIIVKNREYTNSWNVYTSVLGATKKLYLNGTQASTTSSVWNNTAPTSSVFTLSETTNDDYIAYCFHSVDGFSKVGSYIGNGSTDGTFVYTGFRPAYILLKNTTSAYGWYIHDTQRNPYNVSYKCLFPLGNYAESTSIEYYLDINSNGFKLRSDNIRHNGSGETYIYIAFAKNPFKYTNAR